jgi:hypothetical protein
VKRGQQAGGLEEEAVVGKQGEVVVDAEGHGQPWQQKGKKRLQQQAAGNCE